MRSRWAVAIAIVSCTGGCTTTGNSHLNLTFRDCSDCVEMVRVPAGSFMMGSPNSEAGRFDDDEGPEHRVTVAAFAVSSTPIIRADYARFIAETQRPPDPGCAAMDDNGNFTRRADLNWRNPGFQQSDGHPAVCVSWDDAQPYAAYLSSRTGKAYRLLSEAEFEYANRAGSTTAYPWGATAEKACEHADGFDRAAKRLHPNWPSLDCDDGYAFTAPARAYAANAFGLYAMTGNAHQWVEDCFTEGYVGAPIDGSPATNGDCAVRRLRGGSWLNGARGLRAALRDRDRAKDRYNNLGFRVARSLP